MNKRFTIGLIPLLAFFLFAGCKEDQPEPTIKTVAEIPMGTSFLSVEMDGKTQTLIEGEEGVELFGTYNYQVENPNPGYGSGIRLNDMNWSINFFFSQDEYLANTGNYSKLFSPGTFDYLSLNRDFKYVKVRGVEINRSEHALDGSGKWANSSYQEDNTPQKFEITATYFYNTTYDRFIWVEGNFECKIGFFDQLKPAKGKFRLKFQHNLE